MLWGTVVCSRALVRHCRPVQVIGRSNRTTRWSSVMHSETLLLYMQHSWVGEYPVSSRRPVCYTYNMGDASCTLPTEVRRKIVSCLRPLCYFSCEKTFCGEQQAVELSFIADVQVISTVVVATELFVGLMSCMYTTLLKMQHILISPCIFNPPQTLPSSNHALACRLESRVFPR